MKGNKEKKELKKKKDRDQDGFLLLLLLLFNLYYVTNYMIVFNQAIK